MYKNKIYYENVKKILRENLLIIKKIKLIAELKSELNVSYNQIYEIRDKCFKFGFDFETIQEIVIRSKLKKEFIKLFGKVDSARNSLNIRIKELNKKENRKLISELYKSLSIMDNKDDFVGIKTKIMMIIDSSSELNKKSKAEKVHQYIDICSEITNFFEDLRKEADVVDEMYQAPNYLIPSNYSRFTIFTDRDMFTCNDFNLLFSSIEKLYNFICFINNVNSEDYKLIINSFHTGSSLLNGAGLEEIIKQLADIIKDLGKNIYKFTTKELQKERVVNEKDIILAEIDKLDALLKLKAIAEKNGISDFDDILSKKTNNMFEALVNNTTKLDILDINNDNKINNDIYKNISEDTKSSRLKLVHQIERKKNKILPFPQNKSLPDNS